jgi:8-amino-3,8-dideoxy-alpha-D-manno-octulosonate transaminase
MWKAREFEQEVSRFTGAKFAHAVSSGSSAVSVMMAAAGIGHGDEVIVPPFTFVAPIESVFLAGALPVFSEIDESLCLNADAIEKRITPATRAVLLVHMCGAAGDLDGILSVCKKHNLVLLEDCGQAMGAFYRKKSVGLFGAAGSFSFDYFKIATCGEGGAVITNSGETYRKMEQIADHGHTHEGNNRGMEAHHYLGFNYRMNEFSAAVGLAQMRKLPAVLETNRRNKKLLKSKLAGLKNIGFRTLPDEEGDSATFLNFFMPDAGSARQVIEEFGKRNIEGITYWYKNMYHYINQWEHIKNISYPAKLAAHDLKAHQDYRRVELPVSEDLMSRMISISIKCAWTREELEGYSDKIMNSLKKIVS